MGTMDEEVFKSKQSFPNKLLQSDGSITDLAGNTVINATDVYKSKAALPNKWLNPDGTYSTLSEIVMGMIDTDLFIIVDELPTTGESNKIYLLVQNDKIIEYIWVNNTWDPVGMIEFDLTNYYTKSEITELLTATLNSAKEYANTNFLKKDNTTAYTPTANYHPATKKYVDDNAVSFKSFPNTFVTNGTTQQFLNSITGSNLPAGMVYLGQVSLSDMPSGVTVQAEVEVYIYPQNVAYCVMRSAEVSPYMWECNSYQYRGWEALNRTANEYTDAAVSAAEASAVSTANDYTDTQISEKITQTLGGSY